MNGLHYPRNIGLYWKKIYTVCIYRYTVNLYNGGLKDPHNLENQNICYLIRGLRRQLWTVNVISSQIIAFIPVLLDIQQPFPLVSELNLVAKYDILTGYVIPLIDNFWTQAFIYSLLNYCILSNQTERYTDKHVVNINTSCII